MIVPAGMIDGPGRSTERQLQTIARTASNSRPAAFLSFDAGADASDGVTLAAYVRIRCVELCNELAEAQICRVGRARCMKRCKEGILSWSVNQRWLTDDRVVVSLDNKAHDHSVNYSACLLELLGKSGT